MCAIKYITTVIVGSFVALILSFGQVNAALVASEDFNYTTSDGATLTGVTINGGIGWANAWQQGVAGVLGIYVSDSNRSLSFSQDPALTTDGSNYVFAATNTANRRNLSTGVSVSGGRTLYYTMLVRSFTQPHQTAGGVLMRVGFFDGADASGNMRANVGIDGTSLFAAASSDGYSPSGGVSTSGVFADETTYLLAIKRTGPSISAALIEADGDLSTLDAEPAWQVTQAGSTGVTFNSLRLIINGTNTSLRVDELRVATTWEDAVSGIAIHSPTGKGFSATFPDFSTTELLQAGIFEAVDMEATGEAMHWTHSVSQAGDYRLGMAWLEVLSGRWVQLSIKAGGRTVREFTAGPGIEPVRLETRFEGLEVGDTIEVTVIPEPATQYRLGFHLACATPNFDGFSVFHVADFGAVGDGETDDMAAIHQAVDAARAADGGIIRFEAGKTYRTIGLTDMTREQVFPLAGASNISIEGNGATLVLHPPDGFADVSNARNIQIDGFLIDYLPLPYYQGEIVGIDMDNMTIDLTVADRYPVPETGVSTFNPFFGRSFVPDYPGARSGSGDNIYVNRTERIGGERDVRIYVPEFADGSDTPNSRMYPRLLNAKNSGATEFVVPDLKYGHRDGRTIITGSGRIVFSNLRWYCVPYFWIFILDNIGPVTLQNVDLQMKEPETELLASWRDGFHIKNSRFGVTVDGSDIDGAAMYDDTFAIYTRVHRLLGADGTRLEAAPDFRNQKDFETWRVGDWVSVWNAEQTVLRGMSRLLEAENVTGEDRFFLTLESLPDGFQAGDTLINEEVLNRNTLIRNSCTTNVGTGFATTRFRASDIHFEDNHFEDFYFRVEFDPFWGTPRSRGVHVRDSYIDSPLSIDLLWPIGVRFDNVRLNKALVSAFRAEDVRLNDMQWTSMSENIANLNTHSTAWLYGDSTRNGSAAGLANRVSVDGTSSLTFGMPPGPPPTLAATAGEGKVSLEWSLVGDAVSYTMYRSLAAGGPFLRLARTQPGGYVDGGLDPGSEYYYVITATDGDGNESSFSNIVSAQPAGTRLTPQADAYVEGGLSADSNFGTATELLCKTDPLVAGLSRESYLRFDPSSLPGTVGGAWFRLKVASTTGSGDLHTAHAVADDRWEETSITWNNKPSAGAAIASAPSPAAGNWIALDVTDQVVSELAGNQMFSTVLISDGDELVRYHSREVADEDDRPALMVVMMSAPLPSVPTGLSAVEDEAGSVHLSWDGQGGPGEVTYRIYRSTHPSGPYNQLMDTRETTFVDEDAVIGQTFYYRVAAINSDGYVSEPGGAVRLESFPVHESFDYFDTVRLANGTANRGAGWASGWQAQSGGGLQVVNRRIDQTSAAGSTRGIARPFSLDGPSDYYFAFFARADSNGTFSFRLKQTSPGPYVRWAFSRNTDGSMTIQGGLGTATSAPGLFAADKEYLVVSKFAIDGDIASVKLIDPADPGDYLSEPAVWDLSASGATGVTINQLDLEAARGVTIDDIIIGGSYAEVMGIMASEVPVLLTPGYGDSAPYAFPNFSWTEHREQFREMDAPVNYEIEIAGDEAFNSIVDRDIVGLPRYVHDHPLGAGVYFWRVRSLTGGGRVSEWSAVSSFEIVAYDETVTVYYDPTAGDHSAEVLAAVAQTASLAGQGKSVKLVFPPGDYHFGDESIGTLINLPGVRNVAVEGTGANLHFVSHRQSLMNSEGSDNVSLSGFRVYYAPGALRIQGTVTAVEPETSTVTLAIEPGYPDFETGTIRAVNIFLLLDPEIDGRQKTDSVSFYRTTWDGYSRNRDGTWRVTLDRESTPEWEVGDRFVYHFRAGSPVLTRFDNSRAVTLYGLALGGWGNMMISSLEGSLINILHVDTFFQEGEWMVGNADGVHIRGHVVGPWIEGTRIQGTGDDGVALYARPASMSGAKPGGMQNAAVFVDDFFNLEAGDEVAFFEPGPGTILLETRVVSVTQADSGWLVEFENDLPEGMTFDGALTNVTQVWNRSKSCGDFMIRNGRMINNRRYATVFRSRRGIVENMQYRGASARSIAFINEPQFPNGLYASEIILRNNRIADSGFVSNGAPAMAFWFRSHGGGSPSSIGPRNLLIEDNIFSDVGNPEISVNHTRNAVVRNNRTFDGDSFTDAELAASNSERIVFSVDDVSSDGTPPSAPTGLKAFIMGEGIALEWDLGSNPDAALFSVYRADERGGPYTLLADNLLFSEYEDFSVSADSVYFYTITASDIAGNESNFSDSASATLGRDYAIWSARWPDVDLSDPDADFDGDGLSNNEERIWGLDPTDPASMNPIVALLEADGTIRYSRRDPALTGKRFTVWTSTNLRNWTEDTGAIQQPAPDATEVDVEIVEVIASPHLLLEPRLFVRVVADK